MAGFARVPGSRFGSFNLFGIFNFEFPLTAVSPSAVVPSPVNIFFTNCNFSQFPGLP